MSQKPKIYNLLGKWTECDNILLGLFNKINN